MRCKTWFQAVGQDLVLMFGGQTSSQAGGERSGRKIRLELTDVELIRENVPLVGAVSAEIMIRNANVLRGYRQRSISVRGVEVLLREGSQHDYVGRPVASPEDYLKKQRTWRCWARRRRRSYSARFRR